MPSPALTQTAQNPAQSMRALKFVALAIFLVGVALSLVLAWQMQQDVQRVADQRFDQQVRVLTNELTTAFEKSLGALSSLTGIHATDGGFSRQKFRAYWAARGFQKDFRGVRGFGFIEYVQRSELEPFRARQRRDHAPDFEIKTQGGAASLYVITLVEPVERNRAAVGLDIGREAVRRAGAEQALRSGAATLTGVITLVQDERQGPGFLLLSPLYRGGGVPETVEERQARHVGFVYCPVIADELFAPMVKLTAGQSDFVIRTDGAPNSQTLVFDSRNKDGSAHRAAFERQVTLTVAGRVFSLDIYSTPTFEAGIERARGVFVTAAGLLISGLLALAFWLVAAGRARAEARAHELTREMQRLALVAERTNNSVLITDADNRITWVNAAFTRLSGQTLDEVKGRRASEVRGHGQDPQTLHRIREALERGEGLSIETVNQGKDGRVYWVDLDLQPLRDEADRYTGYVAVERDITAFREAQERERQNAAQLAAALRDSQALMDTINTHAIVSETGPDGRITRINDAFCRISGYRREELLGQDHRIVNSGVQDQAFWQGMWKTISSGKPWRGQICNRAKDGRLSWVDSLIAPFLDASGKIEKYVSIRFDITQSREIEQELAHERQRLQNTLEGTKVGTWEVNVITGENQIDARWAGMLGYALDELAPVTPEKWKTLTHPDDNKAFDCKLKEYLRGQADIFEMERRLKHKDGHWVWVLSRGVASTHLPDGRVEWMAGTHMDVTDRHLLQDQVEQRNNLMSAIIENMPGGLSAFDADLNLILRNDQFAKLLQLPDALFARQPITFESMIRHNAERGEYGAGNIDEIVAAIVERARHPSAHVMERTRPDGSVLEVRGLPLPGGGFVSTFTDITQRKLAEKEARQADEILRQAINTLDEAFVVFDDQDRLLMCNERYRSIYKASAPAIQPGRTFEEIIRYGAEHGQISNISDRAEEWVQERLRQHRAADTDMIQELDDHRFLRIIERKTSDGYIVGFRIDVTDLVRARMAAEGASKSKSQFLANMSHEIRTPMNAILGMLNLLHNTELSTRQLDYVNKTEGAAKSLLALLNDILDFSKVEAGKMTLETAPFRIDHLMRDLSIILSSNTGTKNVEVLFDIDPRLPDILMGDSLRLKQVLINLGGNAIKFTETGMVLLRIAVVELQADRATLEFSVRDTGIGIAPENLHRIFEGFSQAEASTTRRFGGTGLGLVISARLVNLMGGQLEVESEPGKGSRFHFRIAMGMDQEEAPAIEAPVPADVRDMEVLIVDDNETARQVLQAMVKPMGWRAELASSGEEALTLIRQRIAQDRRPHDAVFVDWQMPGMDGWETSLQIRQLLAGQAHPILVMVTARGREMLAKRPPDEQALLNGFLVKPVTPSMLLDAIMEARQQQQGGPAERTVAAATTGTQRLRGMRVLLVEDNKINQQVAQELLEREGAQVTLADNGELGVQAIASAPSSWDVVLMDVQMPVMDGYTAARKVRQELKLASLPIIAMTANAMESDRLDALAAGMNAHVGKPFNLNELVRTMLEHSGYVPPEAGAAAEQAAPAPRASEDTPTLLANTAEFDITSALERLGGNTRALARILQAFARDLPRQPQELAALLLSGHGDETRRLLHTLKGTAATVGAHRLSAVAAEAEHHVVEGNIPAGEAARAMVARIQAAVDAASADLTSVLRQLQPPEATAVVGTPVNRTQLRADLEQLMTLLRNSDLACLDLFTQLRERHGPTLSEALEALDEALAGLDFGLAVQLCEQLQQHYTS